MNIVTYSDVKEMTNEEYFNGNSFAIAAFNLKYKQNENETYVEALHRVTTHIASVEATPELRKYWAERWFDEIFNDWWNPAGSVMQGAGSGKKISLGNCNTISLGVLDDGKEWDNIESIVRNTGYTVAKSAAYRQGLGVDFSRLRPRGVSVDNSSKISTGAVHWMDWVDKLGYYVGQDGRIPAMLFSLSVSHPDVEEFIQVKKDFTRIQNANISVQTTDAFYEAVRNDDDWELSFTVPGVKKGDKIYIDVHSALMSSKTDKIGTYYICDHDKDEETITKIVKAKTLFTLIAKNMWENAEPGIQNIDIARKYSNSDAVYNPNDIYDSRILSTNACSEQYLSRDSLCILASIIMSRFATDIKQYKLELAIISSSVNRFLDNVNEYELLHKTYATPFQEMAIRKLRRTGAGITDIGGWLFKKDLAYGSKEANDGVEEFARSYNYELYKSSRDLGREKGSFELFDPEKIKNSKFIQNFLTEFPDFDLDALRNVTCSSIAPTGTLTLMARTSLMSYGVEPSFGMYYWKRTRISGEYKYYFIVPSVLRDKFTEHGLKIPGDVDVIEDTWDGARSRKIVDYINKHIDKTGIKFVSASDIDPNEKMDMMGKLMRWVDSSISVTYLLNENSTLSQVEQFILRGHKLGVKSIAAFPDKKMYGIVSTIPFKELATKLIEDGISIHSQNFSDKEKREMLISDERIVYTSAPKRPKKLKADIYQLHIKGEKYLMVVGLLNGVPYEIFGGKSKDLQFTFRDKKGALEKVKRNHYKLSIQMSKGESIDIENFGHQFTDDEQDKFRLISISLRHGTPIKFIVEQMNKSTDDMFSIAAATSRVLKKYIQDGEIAHGKACPSCGNDDLVYTDGCVSCGCGWSKCD